VTKKQGSYLSSAKNVFSVLTANAAIYAVISVLVALRDRIQGKLDLIETITQEQERTAKGISVDKSRIRDLLTSSLLTVCGQVRSWASETKRGEIEAQMPANRTAWSRVPQIKVAERASAVLEIARKYKDDLIGYGMTDALLQQLESQIAAYKAIVLAPRNAITRRKTLTSLLDQELAGLKEVLDDVLDPLMNQFEDSAPKFFQDYRNARLLVKPATTPIEVIRERAADKKAQLQARKDTRAARVARNAATKAETKAQRQARLEAIGVVTPAPRGETAVRPALELVATDEASGAALSN